MLLTVFTSAVSIIVLWLEEINDKFVFSRNKNTPRVLANCSCVLSLEAARFHCLSDLLVGVNFDLTGSRHIGVHVTGWLRTKGSYVTVSSLRNATKRGVITTTTLIQSRDIWHLSQKEPMNIKNVNYTSGRCLIDRLLIAPTCFFNEFQYNAFKETYCFIGTVDKLRLQLLRCGNLMMQWKFAEKDISFKLSTTVIDCSIVLQLSLL